MNRLRILFVLVALQTGLARADRHDVRGDEVFPGGPTYEEVTEEFFARFVYPEKLEYMGVGAGRDNVIVERIERDGNSWWITCRARYSGRILGRRIGADRVRVKYDNGHVTVDLGGMHGSINTESVANHVGEWVNKIGPWAQSELGSNRAFGFDLAIEHPNGKAYFFSENNYYRFDYDADDLDRRAKIGHPGWVGLWEDGMDAGLIHGGKAFFFKGNKYRRFSFGQERERDDRNGVDKEGTIGVDGWIGVWEDGVDAALIHPEVEKAYFFQGNKYRCFSFRRESQRDDHNGVEKEGIIGVDEWIGVWDDGIDAALIKPEGKKAYFFKGNKYRRFDFNANAVDKEGTIGKSGWRGLGS